MKQKTVKDKSNETRSSLFEKINKIDRLLARLSKGKRENTQITEIRSERGSITNEDERALSILQVSA